MSFGRLKKSVKISLQELAHQRITLQVTQTTQYLRHPSTLKAQIWCVPPNGQNLLSQKIQSSRNSSSRDMAKYVRKITKKREKERVLKMTKKSRKIGHYSETTGPNELKFYLVLGLSIECHTPNFNLIA